MGEHPFPHSFFHEDSAASRETASPASSQAVLPQAGEASILLLCKTLERAAKPRHPLLADIPIITPGEQFMRDCNIEFIRRCRSDRVTEMGPHEAHEFWERKR